MSTIPMTDVISFRASHDLKEKIEQFAEKTKRSKTDLIVNWIEEALSMEEWQLQEIELGIQEANKGQFATQDDVNRVLKKWL